MCAVLEVSRQRLLRVAGPAGKRPCPRQPGAGRRYPPRPCRQPAPLRQPPRACRAAGRGQPGGAKPCRAPDAAARHPGPGPAAVSLSTTDSNHAFPLAANLLARQFIAPAPNRVWLADITYVPTEEGWLYLAVVLDLFARKVVGWAMVADHAAGTDPGGTAHGNHQPAARSRAHAPLGSRQPGRIQAVVATPGRRRLR